MPSSTSPFILHHPNIPNLEYFGKPLWAGTHGPDTARCSNVPDLAHGSECPSRELLPFPLESTSAIAPTLRLHCWVWAAWVLPLNASTSGTLLVSGPSPSLMLPSWGSRQEQPQPFLPSTPGHGGTNPIESMRGKTTRTSHRILHEEPASATHPEPGTLRSRDPMSPSRRDQRQANPLGFKGHK